LERYGHQVVIGNELHTRKYQVVFVERVKGSAAAAEGGEKVLDGGISASKYTEQWMKIREQDGEIEKVMVELLVKRHDRWIENGAGGKK
jgi:phosphopantothenate-cysteine ligase